MGRTGMTGRGLLGRFGPNHAADPIVTRYESFYKRNSSAAYAIPCLAFSVYVSLVMFWFLCSSFQLGCLRKKLLRCNYRSKLLS